MDEGLERRGGGGGVCEELGGDDVGRGVPLHHQARARARRSLSSLFLANIVCACEKGNINLEGILFQARDSRCFYFVFFRTGTFFFFFLALVGSVLMLVICPACCRCREATPGKTVPGKARLGKGESSQKKMKLYVAKNT